MECCFHIRNCNQIQEYTRMNAGMLACCLHTWWHTCVSICRIFLQNPFILHFGRNTWLAHIRRICLKFPVIWDMSYEQIHTASYPRAPVWYSYIATSFCNKTDNTAQKLSDFCRKLADITARLFWILRVWMSHSYAYWIFIISVLTKWMT